MIAVVAGVLVYLLAYVAFAADVGKLLRWANR
jgi:hypothetical protein